MKTVIVLLVAVLTAPVLLYERGATRPEVYFFEGLLLVGLLIAAIRESWRREHDSR